MGRSNLYIHAGPGKTGTTFLQGAVFDRIKSARAIAKPKIALGEDMVQFGDMFDFSPRVWRALEEEPFVGDSSESGADAVISDEMMFDGLASPSASDSFLCFGEESYSMVTAAYTQSPPFLPHVRKTHVQTNWCEISGTCPLMNEILQAEMTEHPRAVPGEQTDQVGQLANPTDPLLIARVLGKRLRGDGSPGRRKKRPLPIGGD